MSAPVVYVWPSASVNYIALVQSLVGAGSIIFNGSGFNTNPNRGYFGFPGFIRTVTLTSVNNVAGVNFTITGTTNGRTLSQTIAGPNANTVETTIAFDTIISITTNGAINAVSVGIGQTGLTQWFVNDYHRSVFNMSAAVDVTNNGGTITYSLLGTLDNVTAVAPFVFNPVAGMIGLNVDGAVNSGFPVRYSAIGISASTGAATLTATFLQQGIT